MVASQGLARGVLLMSAIHCLALIDRTMVAGAMPLVRRSITMTDAQAGWLLGMPFALSFAGAALVLGRIADRVPARQLMIAGLVTWSLASGALGLVHSVSAFAVCRVALGIGQAAFVPAAIAWIVDANAEARRPTAVAAFTTGSTLGRCVSLLAVGVLLLLLGRLGAGEGAWRWLFVVTILPNLLALGCLPGCRPVPTPGSGATRRSAGPNGGRCYRIRGGDHAVDGGAGDRRMAADALRRAVGSDAG